MKEKYLLQMEKHIFQIDFLFQMKKQCLDYKTVIQKQYTDQSIQYSNILQDGLFKC